MPAFTRSSPGLRRLIACLLLCLLPAAPPQAAGLLLLAPGESPLVSQLTEALEGLGHQVQRRDPGESLPETAEIELIVSMGQSALDWRLKQPAATRTLAVYIGLDSIQQLGLEQAQQRPDWLQLLTISPAPDRQLRLAQLHIPRLNSAGLLHSPQQAWQVPLWQQAAERQGIQLHVAPLDNPTQLARRLGELLPRSQVLLGIDDSRVYNPELIKTILLTSYSHDRVLIGPSAPYISAGSLTTSFSSAPQIAEDIHALLQSDWQPGALHFASQFSVMTNQQVARSLGLAPVTDDRLQQQLYQQESPL